MKGSDGGDPLQKGVEKDSTKVVKPALPPSRKYRCAHAECHYHCHSYTVSGEDEPLTVSPKNTVPGPCIGKPIDYRDRDLLSYDHHWIIWTSNT